MTTLSYKGYVAAVELDVEGNLIFGEVVGARDAITFQGETVEEAVRAFHESVDLYEVTCQEHGIEPDRAPSEEIVIRVDPEVRQILLTLAEKEGQGLEEFLSEDVADLAAQAKAAATSRRAARGARRGKAG